MEDIIAKVQELVAAFGIKVATALLVLVMVVVWQSTCVISPEK